MPNSTQSLLDDYKRALRLISDNQAALSLNVTRATVSRWRSGRGHPEPAIVWKMSEAAGKNPALAMVNIEADRCVNLENAQAWQRLRNIYIMSTVAAHMRRKKLLLSERAA